MDFVDVDSAKWTEYSKSTAWPFPRFTAGRPRGCSPTSEGQQLDPRALAVTEPSSRCSAGWRPNADTRSLCVHGRQCRHFSRNTTCFALPPASCARLYRAMDNGPTVDAVCGSRANVARDQDAWPRLRLRSRHSAAPSVRARGRRRRRNRHRAGHKTLSSARGDRRGAFEGGARCNKKSAEALAWAGRLASTCWQAIEGVQRKLCNRTTAEEFVQRIDDLLREPEGALMGAAARRLSCGAMNWSSIYPASTSICCHRDAFSPGGVGASGASPGAAMRRDPLPDLVTLQTVLAAGAFRPGAPCLAVIDGCVPG